MDEDAVASVNDAVLLRKDVERLIPPGLTSADSVARAQYVIKDWAQQQLVLNRAKANLDIDEAEYERRMQDYKNNLMIYDFQEKWLKQKLDREVSEEEIAAYYLDHIDSYVLKDKVVRVKYAVFKDGTPDLKKFGQWMRKHGEEYNNLEVFARDNSVAFDVVDSNWYDYNQLVATLPISESVIRSKMNGSGYSYSVNNDHELFTYVIDKKKKGDPAPMGYVREKIVSTILNNRKKEMLKNMGEDLYNEAVRKGDFQIFDQE